MPFLRRRPPPSPSLTATLTGHGRAVNAAGFSPDGRLLASGCADWTVILWDVTDPARVAQRAALTHPGPDGGARPSRRGSGVRAAGFSPDGRLLASGNADKTVILWDVTDPAHPAQRVTVTHSDRSGAIKAVGFSVDGRLLAVGSGDVINPSGNMPVSRGAVALWDVTDLAHPVRTAIVRAGVQVHAVAFSPDGRLLASGNGGATVILWDVTDPAHLAAAATLTGHRGSVLGVAFSPDGRLLASCGADKTVRLWEVS